VLGSAAVRRAPARCVVAVLLPSSAAHVPAASSMAGMRSWTRGVARWADRPL
jgi:hypothetical protein